MKFSLQLAAAATLLASANASNLTTEAVARPPPPPPPPPPCRYLPSDPQWPNAAAWKSLNSTVGGRLVATVPIGTPCHDPKYNKNVCAQLQTNWELPQTHYTTSSSVMQPFFANQSCDPFTPESKPCVLGNYISYAVNVSCDADVQAALAFATKYNIRVVVRNTGHDFFGRSTGAGALGIWTHNLKSISISTYKSTNYSGPSMKVGAGVQGFEMLQAAHSKGFVAVSGECPTVGVAGGYTQGGGHSALSTSFGLGADQTLEFEVVTAAGQILTASPSKNSDLYWALSGGGSGYGVVTSMTVKLHPDATIGGAKITIAAATTTQDNFNKFVAGFHAMLPAMIDKGAMVIYLLTNTVFVLEPVTVYNSTADYVQNVVLADFNALLSELGITPIATQYTELSYYDHYNTYMGPLPNGNLDVGDFNYGSRLIPRSVLLNNNNALQAVLQNLTAHGVIMVGSSANYAKPAGVNNAVFPVWRTTTVHLQIGTPWNNTAPWSQMLADQKTITNEYVPQLTAVTPGSGAYMNEGDFQQPNFQQTFFGSNYNTLLSIKKKYDPNSLFYGLRLVGSEAWTVDNNGRMCRAK
ncbi:CAZyme family AA7 [Trichoderma aggressivum f. europaeum]|uniref:CAZyme family AA7 n=1 Tax=Trichoderma aggressivum f. europaeum TaxID=173218 RepID=A0AAE1M4Y3_9HYPO|nr:CAZyme family AA7 [Trichoderma aggressivum f. europaeum]